MMAKKTSAEQIQEHYVDALLAARKNSPKTLGFALETTRAIIEEVVLSAKEVNVKALSLDRLLDEVKQQAVMPTLFVDVYVPAMQKLVILSDQEYEIEKAAIQVIMQRLNAIVDWYLDWAEVQFELPIEVMGDEVIRPEVDLDVVRVEVPYQEKILRPMEYHSKEKAPIIMRWATLLVLVSLLVWVIQNPFTAVGYTQRGIAQYELGNYEAAMAYYDRAIRYDPSYAEAYYQRGLVFIEMDKTSFAVEDFEHALALGLMMDEDDDYAQVYFRRGNDYFDAELFTFAIDDYDVALKLDPQASEIYAQRAETQLLLKNYGAAIQDIEKAISINPAIEKGDEYAIAYYSRAVRLIDDGNSESGLTDLNEAIRLNEKYGDSYALRGDLYLMKHQYERAIDDFNQTLEINGESSEIYTKRGLAYNAIDGYHQAIADLELALEMNAEMEVPSAFAHAYFLRGQEMMGLEEFETALGDLDMAVVLNDQNADFYAARSLTKLALEDFDGAIGNYETLLAMDETQEALPAFASAYYERGLAFLDEEDASRAMLDFDKAIGLNIDYALAYHARGMAHVMVGNYVDAMGDLDMALQLDKTIEVDGMYAKAYVSRAKHLAADRSLNEALDDLDAAINLDGTIGEAYFERGLVYLTQGEVEKALADFEEAVALDEIYANEARFGEAYQTAGLSALANGDVDLALEDLEKGLTLDPEMEVSAVFADAYAVRGMQAVLDRDFGQAVADVEMVQNLDASYEVDPIFAEAYVTLAQEMTDDAAKLEALSAAIAIDDTQSETWKLRADVYLGMGDFENAIHDAEMAMELNEMTTLQAEYATAYHLKGLVMIDEKDLVGAREMARIVLALDGEFAFNQAYAQVFYVSGMKAFVNEDFVSAVADLEMTVKIDASYPNAASKLALAKENL